MELSILIGGFAGILAQGGKKHHEVTPRDTKYSFELHQNSKLSQKNPSFPSNSFLNQTPGHSHRSWSILKKNPNVFFSPQTQHSKEGDAKLEFWSINQDFSSLLSQEGKAWVDFFSPLLFYATSPEKKKKLKK